LISILAIPSERFSDSPEARGKKKKGKTN